MTGNLLSRAQSPRCGALSMNSCESPSIISSFALEKDYLRYLASAARHSVSSVLWGPVKVVVVCLFLYWKVFPSLISIFYRPLDYEAVVGFQHFLRLDP